MNKRLWFCSACGFYHNLDSVCPKTGQAYERKVIEALLGIPHSEQIKIKGKVREKHVK